MIASVLAGLGVELPVLAAPMAGGPTSPELVRAAAGAGAFGFLAGGYRSAPQLAEQLAAVRTAATDAFGVNLFAPNPVPVAVRDYARYRDEIHADAERFGVDLPPAPVEDDDYWRDKIDLLIADPVPIVSFTFGIPDGAVRTALRRAGSLLMQTVTSPDEARRATEAGMDLLAVQASTAGGHSGTLTPGRLPAAQSWPVLLPAIGAVTGLPLVAAGGLSDAAAVATVLTAGAVAAMVGTALLLAPEAGTSAVHRAALAAPDRGATLITRAFTGRPARALPNRFIATHDAGAPLGYPAIHHLTSPLRKAAAAAGDPEAVHLWAGAGYRAVREQAVARTLRELAGG